MHLFPPDIRGYLAPVTFKNLLNKVILDVQVRMVTSQSMLSQTSTAKNAERRKIISRNSYSENWLNLSGLKRVSNDQKMLI